MIESLLKTLTKTLDCTLRAVSVWKETMMIVSPNMTLHELCDQFHISRRTIQGYEKHGLVKATGKTKHGYLLYDAAAQKQILQLRKLQSFGFTLSEIKALIDLPPESLKMRLLEKRDGLMEKQDQLREALEQIDRMIAEIL